MLKTEFTLYDDQQQFVVELRKSVLSLLRVIGCAATGSGKSKVFCTIAASAVSKGRTVLILSESRRIFSQVQAEIEATEIKAGSELQFIERRKVYLAMAQSLSLRAHLIEQFDALKNELLVICDECHIGTPTKILLKLQEALLIGFSATPSAREAPHLPVIYKGIVIGPQPHQLVLNGRLACYKHFARHKADLSKLEMRGGEFTELSQAKAFETRKVYEGICEDLRTIPFRKALIFTSSIQHCEALTAELKSKGFSCVQVHSALGEATEAYNLAQFMQRLVPICVSVGILTKGFDYPPIDLIALMRATTSLPLYCQMIGRGSRLSPGTGKEYFTVLDYGENWKHHNLWDYEHDWATLWKNVKKRKKIGVAPVKNCPRCEFICAASALTCPNCGHRFVKTSKEIKEEKEKTVLVEITKVYNEQLVGRKISELSARELAIYAKLKNKSGFAVRVARWKAQNNPAFLEEFRKEMGYRNGWVDHQLQLVGLSMNQFTDIVLR